MKENNITHDNNYAAIAWIYTH